VTIQKTSSEVIAMSDIQVKSDAVISVYVDPSVKPTVQTIRDWLAEVDRLHIPSDHVLEDCVLDLVYRSEILDDILGESSLGVEGYDILVGMPR
jgi:hypothetical protein